MKLNNLTHEEERIILHKGTETPFTGEYLSHTLEGTYICRRCNSPLYHSADKFDSGCGWPSFDDEIPDAVKHVPDADGRRTEIVCACCGAHLGHVFVGEAFTPKNTRHCVNSLSIRFVAVVEQQTSEAYFASGCFWGTEFYFMHHKGVLKTTVGFMGGHVPHPTYEQVCQQDTGHLEVVKVEYDGSKTNYEELVRLFFETHNFTQVNGQGPDIGPQYLSCIFYTSEDECLIAKRHIAILESKGYTVATMLRPAGTFWPAEPHHQQYYSKQGTRPYCHKYTKVF